MFGILCEARVKVWMEMMSCLWTNTSICVSELWMAIRWQLQSSWTTLPNNLKEVLSNFKSKPSHCNLPLLERCSCDGELLPFTTQNFNSFLTNCKYFEGTHFVLQLKLLSIWRCYCVAHVFIHYVHIGNHEHLCS